MQSWRLNLEYEGTRFQGWQIQPNRRTIQGELINASRKFLETEVRIGGAGRTDAGVHAINQVAHLRATPNSRAPTCKQIKTGLNSLLPHDINVVDVSPVDTRFHARHDALSRYYLYQISTRRSAFAKPFVWWVRDRLDVPEMIRVLEQIQGTFDFGLFSERRDDDASTVVKIMNAEIKVVGHLILIRIGAERFLWKMVRRLVGAVVEFGRRKGNLQKGAGLFDLNSNQIAAMTAPPSGLFLERVLYPGDPVPGVIHPLLQVP